MDKFQASIILFLVTINLNYVIAQTISVQKKTIRIKKERVDDTLTMPNRRAYYLDINRDAGLIQFFDKNKKLPNDVASWFLCGVIYVQFTINDSGNVKKVKILNTIKGCNGCAKEAERVAKSVPNKFFPAVENNKYVTSTNTYAITFKRNDKVKCR